MNLRKGNGSNIIELFVDNVEIKSHFHRVDGAGMIVKINQYNIEDLLCQMIDDYGEDKLIEMITAL